MATQFLTPFFGRRSLSQSRRPEDIDPLLAFRRDMGSLFDDFFGGFGVPSLAVAPSGATAAVITPPIDVSETDQEPTETPRSAGFPSMTHQHGQGHAPQHVACHPAQNHLTQARVTVSAHDQEIAAELGRF